MPGIPKSLTAPTARQLVHHEYPSESPAVRAAIRAFFERYPHALLSEPHEEPPIVVDHSMYTGVWGRVLKEFRPNIHLVGVDIQFVARTSDAYDSIYLGWDFLERQQAYLASGKRRPHMAIGNPPFKHLEAFTHASLDLVRQGGWVYTLVPDTFMSTQARSERLWKQKCPQWVLHSTKRWRFDRSKSGTDYKEYLTVIHEVGNYPTAEQGGYKGWWFDWDYTEPFIDEDEPSEIVSPQAMYLAWLHAVRSTQGGDDAGHESVAESRAAVERPGTPQRYPFSFQRFRPTATGAPPGAYFSECD